MHTTHPWSYLALVRPKHARTNHAPKEPYADTEEDRDRVQQRSADETMLGCAVHERH